MSTHHTQAQAEYAAHEAEYYAAVRSWGLVPTNVPHIYRGPDNEHYRVPSPVGMTPDQCAATLKRIRIQMAPFGAAG